MEKAQEILYHIDELYTENPSEEKIIRQSAENPIRYQAWVDAFKEYDLSDVLLAIDHFWEFKSSKTRPNVSQIKAILNSHKAEKIRVDDRPEFKAIEPASQHMEADIASGNCHHLLNVYQMAVDYILRDRLIELIGVSEWQKLRYGQKYDLAEENNLFDDFDDVLRLVCKRNFGVEEQFQSENDLINAKERRSVTDSINTLSAHWGLD